MQACPCCGYYTVESFWDICRICYWEFDPAALSEPLIAIGPNRVSLYEAQRNFEAFGASEENMKDLVQAPSPQDARVEGFQPMLHPAIASILEDWVTKINIDEFHFPNSFEQLFKDKIGHTAFDFIPYMVDAVLATEDEFIMHECIYYLHLLNIRAKTTELHPYIKKHLETIDKIATGPHAKREWQSYKYYLRL